MSNDIENQLIDFNDEKIKKSKFYAIQLDE